MKKTFILLAFTATLFIYSCNQGTDKNQQDAVDSVALNINCYTAIFENDTAYLKIQTDKNDLVTGDLTMKYGEVKPNSLENVINVGTISGKYNGDTLFVDYTHTSGSIHKKGFVNPLAFLSSGDTLILGVGDIITHLGRTYFVKDKPIDYKIARFRFIPSDCQE